MTKRVPAKLTVRMPKRRSASVTAMDVGGSGQKVTMLPSRPPLNLARLGLKRG